MNILVTGGAGFIGRHVVANLRQRGHQVMVYDLIPPTFDDAIYCCGDIRDSIKLTGCIAQADAVMHLAGVLGTAESLDDPKPSVTTNIVGSLNVFEACRLEARRCCYIAVGNHFMLNPYAITKTTAEKLALMYNAEHATRIAVVRGLNAYGPYQKHKPIRKVIPNFILSALRNEPVLIYGSGEQIMDFIYVEDLAEILCRALLDEHSCYGSIIEAGSGRATTINEVALKIIELAGSHSPLSHHGMRPGEIEHSVVLGNVQTLRHLHYDPSDMMPLVEGLKRTIAYYREHLDTML